VTYSHKVIVESEEICEKYIKNFDRIFGNKLGNGANKFVALGSPKFDRIAVDERVISEIPSEWHELIGSKKVVLYNTSIGGISQSGEQYLKKLESVIETFKNCESAVLWWRPHPLSEAAYESMQHELLAKYRQIVVEYRAAGFGIYDDSPNLHRAIARSDAYYGDSSSLVAMYAKTAKPVMLQNVHILTTECDEFVSAIMDFVVKDNIMWFIAPNICGIFTLDLATNDVSFVVCIPAKKCYIQPHFVGIDIEGDYVVLTPWAENNVVRYSISTGVFERSPLENAAECNFGSTLKFDGNLYMLPYQYPTVVKYEIETNEIIQSKKLCEVFKEINITLSSRQAAIDADGVITMAGGSIVVMYSFVTDECVFQQVGASEKKYSLLEKTGDWFWLISHDGSVVKWNDKTGEVKEISGLPPNFSVTSTDKTAFYQLVTHDDCIYLFPWFSNMILKICTKSEEIKAFVDLDERANQHHFRFDDYSGNYPCAKIVGDNIYAYSCYEKVLQKIDPKTGEIVCISLELPKEHCAILENACLSYFREIEETFSENSFINLSNLLRWISPSMDYGCSDNGVESVGDNLRGSAIYKYVKDCIT
jgi:hypothetical protein